MSAASRGWRGSVRVVVVLGSAILPVIAWAGTAGAIVGGTGRVQAATSATTESVQEIWNASPPTRSAELPPPLRPGEVLPVAPENLPEAGVNIFWSNRGPGDGFDTIFGAGADRARAVVDGAIDAWEQTLLSLSRPSGGETISITVNMNAAAPGRCGGSASGNFDGDGWPTGGAVNVNGNANVWFIDQTPNEYSEFAGNIVNGFAGDAQGTSPAAGLCDMYTVVTAEMMHILGVTSNGGARFQTGGFNTQLTFTGTTCSGPGDLWQFTGPSITHLMTSNNGGTGGSDFGVPVHTAEPCASFGALQGADDAGNALFEIGRRYLPPNSGSLILKDTYNFDTVMPETFGTFYSNLNATTGLLTLTGGDDGDVSNDVISIARSFTGISVSVDVGNDVPATGPTDAFVSRYAVGEVQSITVNALDGNDTVTVSSGLGVPVTINGGDGNDTLIGAEGNDTISGGSGNDQLFAGSGNNTVTDGSGNDLVDLSQNSVAINYLTGGGNDTVLGTAFSDTITGSSGTDRLQGGPAADTLIGEGGADALLGEDGSDTFIWDDGDGSDTIEGGAGDSDFVQVNSAATGEDFTVSALPGSRVRVSRSTLPAFTLDIASAEDLELNVGGGADGVVLNDLSPTGVRDIEIDLGAGDADDVRVTGGPGADRIELSPLGASQVDVGGLSYALSILQAEAADTVRVNGAAGADTLIANGTGVADALSFFPLDGDSADLTGAGPTAVRADEVEQVIVDGEGGNDALIVESPSGAQDVTVRTGAGVDAGSIVVDALLPLEFRDLGLAGSVELQDADGGRADRLVYEGTGAGDSFGVAAGTGVVTLNAQLPVTPTGVLNLVLNGLAGDDQVAAAATLPFDTSTVNGGDSSGGDAVSLSGASGAVTVDLGTRAVTGYGGTVLLTGVEQLATSQDGGVATDLTVLGTGATDNITYTPTGANSGLVSQNGPIPNLSFGGAGGAFTIDPVGDADTVSTMGTLNPDSVLVSAGAVTTVQVGTTKMVNIPVASTESIGLLPLGGADTIDVTVFDNVSPRFTLDGGEPTAFRAGDALLVRNGSPTHVMYQNLKSMGRASGTVLAKYMATGHETRIDYRSVEDITFFH